MMEQRRIATLARTGFGVFFAASAAFAAYKYFRLRSLLVCALFAIARCPMARLGLS